METSISTNKGKKIFITVLAVVLFAGSIVILKDKIKEAQMLKDLKKAAENHPSMIDSPVPDLGKALREESINIPPKQTFGIEALFDKKFDGRDLTVGQKQESNSAYDRYFITYKSGELTISGIMNVPKGAVPEGGFPVLILNHGHIDKSIYTNGRGLRREQDYLAREGFVVLHPDYRNHAQSSKTDDDAIEERLGYVEDAINAVYAVKNSDLSYLNKEKIGMLGHSMGGGIAQTIAVVKPDLVKGYVLYASVSMDLRDTYERWMKVRPETVSEIAKHYGIPTDNPEFWDSVSAEPYSDRIVAPLSYHHGTRDADVPVEWTEQTVALLQSKNKNVAKNIYQGEGHEFGPQWTEFMSKTTDFFKKTLGVSS